MTLGGSSGRLDDMELLLAGVVVIVVGVGLPLLLWYVVFPWVDGTSRQHPETETYRRTEEDM